jgi:hypothetical protein
MGSIRYKVFQTQGLLMYFFQYLIKLFTDSIDLVMRMSGNFYFFIKIIDV